MNKISLFDFCETLVSIQSHDAFIGFYLKKNFLYYKYMKFLIYKSVPCKVLQKIMGISFKYKLLSLLKNEPRNLIEEASKIFSKILLQKQNSAVLKKLIELNENQDVIIVSAGFKINIEDFLISCCIDNVIVVANELDYDSDICIGRYTKKDCFGYEKVNRLMECQNYSSEINYCFTDSITDLPILNLSENQYIVENNNTIVEYEESKIYKGMK